MKKIIVLLLVLIMCSSAFAGTGFMPIQGSSSLFGKIDKLYWEDMLASVGSNADWLSRVPMKVTVADAAGVGATVVESAVIGEAGMSLLTANLLFMAGAVGVDLLFDPSNAFFQHNKITSPSSGNFNQTQTKLTVNNSMMANPVAENFCDMWGDGYCFRHEVWAYKGVYDSYNAAQSAANASGSCCVINNETQHIHHWVCSADDPTGINHQVDISVAQTGWFRAEMGGSPIVFNYYFYPLAGATMGTQEVNVGITPDDMRELLAAGVGDSDQAVAAGAKAVQVNAMKSMGNAIDNPQSPVAKSSVFNQNVQTLLNGVPQQNFTTNYNNAVTNNNNITNNVDQNQNQLTQDQVRQAVQDAITNQNTQAAGENLPSPPSTTPPGNPPDKGSVAPILSSYAAGLTQLPLLSFLTDLKTVGASGTCQLCIPLPGLMGGSSSNSCINFCQWQTSFDFMGSCLLLITAIRWTMYLFMSGSVAD